MKKLSVFVLMFILASYSFAVSVATFQIVTSASMAANITSLNIPLATKSSYAIQAVWTGVPVGTLSVNVSNDILTPVHWTPLSGASISLSGSAGNQVYNVFSANYTFAQLVYTASSGTGTLNATATVKGN